MIHPSKRRTRRWRRAAAGLSLSGDDLLLAGPAKLAPGEFVYLDIADGAIRAQGRVWSETPAGHKTVRLEHVWAEEGAFERWQAGATLASSTA